MPTGYTASIADGIDFKKFVLQCSRAFGALITMRDDPMDAPIPEKIEPSDYHKKEIRRVKADMKKLAKISPLALKQAAQKEYIDELKSYKQRCAKTEQLKRQYQSMLQQVNEWQPPTADHTELKKFMIQQLEISIDFDCKVYPFVQEKLSPKQWFNQEKKRLIKDLAYHEEHDKEEIERASERTKWIQDLINSI